MPRKNLTIFFLTEDIRNLKERNEIEYLKELGRVVLVSPGKSDEKISGVRHLRLKSPAARVERLIHIWAKLAYVLCGLADSKTDKYFPLRNVYSGNALVRWLVNKLWVLKATSFASKCLPRYDTVFFLPFMLWGLFSGQKMRRSGPPRLIMHDSLCVRLLRFAPLIAQARRAGVMTVGNVKSWDNPFYSQFATRADGYFLWSDVTRTDLERVQTLSHHWFHVWGARPFFRFVSAWRACGKRRPAPTPSAGKDRVVVGYAAAFPDDHMGRHEIALIRSIAELLQQKLKNYVLSVRPYPIVPVSHYAELAKLPNVEIADIAGEAVDRYGDGKEFIRFGSDEERISYIAGCDYFLSMATSFTIEATICGVPVVHFYREPEQCKLEHEREFFLRLMLSDHLHEYFVKRLTLAGSYEELLSLLGSTPDATWKKRQDETLRSLGVPSDGEEWPAPTPDVEARLQRFAVGENQG